MLERGAGRFELRRGGVPLGLELVAQGARPTMLGQIREELIATLDGGREVALTLEVARLRQPSRGPRLSRLIELQAITLVARAVLEGLLILHDGAVVIPAGKGGIPLPHRLVGGTAAKPYEAEQGPAEHQSSSFREASSRSGAGRPSGFMGFMGRFCVDAL